MEERTMRSRVFKLLLLAALAATLAAPATTAAATPSITRITVPDKFVADVGACTQDVDTMLTLVEKVYFDQAGNPTRVQLHFQYVGTATIIETGTVYRLHHNFMVTTDLATGR